MAKQITTNKGVGSGNEDGKAKTWLTAGAALAAILIAVFSIWNVASRQPRIAAGPQTPLGVYYDTLTQLANKCQGNFNQLTPAEQNKANSMTNGQGAAKIAKIYNSFKMMNNR